MSRIATKWVEDNAITKEKVNTDVAGDGLGGGGGSALAVDTTVIRTTGVNAFTADQSMGTNKLTNLADGTASSDAVNKGQLDAVAAGIRWVEPAATKDYMADRTIAQINALTPVAGQSLVATDAGTPSAGSSDALAAGDVAEYNGTEWKKIVSNSGGFVPAGTRLLVSDSIALLAPLTNATDEGKYADFDGTTNTPTLTSPEDGDGILVHGDLSVNETKQYTFNGSVPTGSWVNMGGLVSVTAGTGLTKSGDTLNVGDAGKGVQVNADDLEFSAAEAVEASGGLKAGANSWELAVEPADFAGTGLEDDGSDNLRLSAQGNGIAGGAGSTLSVDPDSESGGNIIPVSVGANGVGIDISNLNGFYAREEHVITAGETTAGQFTLANAYIAATVSARPANGPGQSNAASNPAGTTADFEISGTNFKFNASSSPSETLSGHFGTNDHVIIEGFYTN